MEAMINEFIKKVNENPTGENAIDAWWRYMDKSGEKITLREFLILTDLPKDKLEQIINKYHEPGLDDAVFNFLKACKN